MDIKEIEVLIKNTSGNAKKVKEVREVQSRLRKEALIYLAQLLSEKNTSPAMAATITELIIYFKI